ncbi:hypothetical protein [Mesorhizobium sp. LNJC394B00]|uniref:hypothetical protein n=1 Tax=Mesorhizobium sp. LNJC394B00 TaxID=1287274 RepID=UPI000418C40D|nr:hypothetical protein [Mesorhizobium sp. LNJC394B00]
MTALATASLVIIVRLKPCLSFLPFRSLRWKRNAIAIAGPLHPSIASALPFRFAIEFLAREAGVLRDEAGHVRLRVASTVITRSTMMITAKRPG